jgi:hypothetical protein
MIVRMRAFVDSCLSVFRFWKLQKTFFEKGVCRDEGSANTGESPHDTTLGLGVKFYLFFREKN